MQLAVLERLWRVILFKDWNFDYKIKNLLNKFLDCDSCVTQRNIISGFSPNKCLCIDGLYDNVSGKTCSICHYSCLTCIGPTSNECLTCSAPDMRSINISLASP